MNTRPKRDPMQLLDHPEIPELFQHVFSTLVSESDLGAVLIGTSHVDKHLRDLFEAVAPEEMSKRKLRSILDFPGVLSGLAARTQLAYLCRLIGKPLFDAIETLRGLRNQIAHAPNSFALAAHSEQLHKILNLGPGVPTGINQMACQIVVGSFLERASKISIPESDQRAFETPADVLEYVARLPDVMESLNKRLPKHELGGGIVLICAQLIHLRKASVETAGATSLWPRFQPTTHMNVEDSNFDGGE